ncbi:hypothetical protein OG946_00280 [Streptomyces sp. NBC_01808]|uniref:hypothetical protein n=1 Tax=Streptomyces sp. NBC_01808 TaxID=2975947 RepID=UPI002DD85C02|nr:hypothetical protein [Streptomyces sp. NBC_01808]WSA35945.1 hypothetical protein OG946_00280 [Streptomyces sp. NBC_01808]
MEHTAPRRVSRPGLLRATGAAAGTAEAAAGDGGVGRPGRWSDGWAGGGCPVERAPRRDDHRSLARATLSSVRPMYWQRSVSDGWHKLIRYRPAHGIGTERAQLFDLADDPHDLADAAAHQVGVARLSEELVRWQVAVGDRAEPFGSPSYPAPPG